MQSWYKSRLGEQTRNSGLTIEDRVLRQGEEVGRCISRLDSTGAVRVEYRPGDGPVEEYLFDGQRFAVRRDGQWKEMTATEAKLSPLLLQAMAMASIQTAEPFARFGEVSLDGGDKALGRPAIRFKSLDPDEDWFYFWINLYDQNSDEAESLVQISADKDCDGKGRGVTFNNWQPHAGWLVAAQRVVVQGLAKQPELQLQFESATPLNDPASNWANVNALIQEGQR